MKLRIFSILLFCVMLVGACKKENCFTASDDNESDGYTPKFKLVTHLYQSNDHKNSGYGLKNFFASYTIKEESDVDDIIMATIKVDIEEIENVEYNENLSEFDYKNLKDWEYIIPYGDGQLITRQYTVKNLELSKSNEYLLNKNFFNYMYNLNFWGYVSFKLYNQNDELLDELPNFCENIPEDSLFLNLKIYKYNITYDGKFVRVEF